MLQSLIEHLPEYRNPCWESRLAGSQVLYKQNPYPRRTKESYFTRLTNVIRDKQMLGDTFRVRCLPLVYLVGVTKSGTTDLYGNIVQHPDVVRPATKEPMWWNRLTIGNARSGSPMIP